MRIIVINLDHDTGRRARIERRLVELGLRWERLSAVHPDRPGETGHGERTVRRLRVYRALPGPHMSDYATPFRPAAPPA